MLEKYTYNIWYKAIRYNIVVFSWFFGKLTGVIDEHVVNVCDSTTSSNRDSKGFNKPTSGKTDTMDHTKLMRSVLLSYFVLSNLR